MANASCHVRLKGQRVWIRATEAGLSGCVSRFQDLESHVSVLGRKRGPDTWASTHGLQSQEPLGLPYIPLESLDARMVLKHVPFCRAAAPVVGSSVPEAAGFRPAGLPLHPGLSPRSWAFRLSCPSPALRANHHESCKGSLLTSQNHIISHPPPVPCVGGDIEASMRKVLELSQHSVALWQSQD